MVCCTNYQYGFVATVSANDWHAARRPPALEGFLETQGRLFVATVLQFHMILSPVQEVDRPVYFVSRFLAEAPYGLKQLFGLGDRIAKTEC
jgi:hypothetical protein